MMEFFAMGGYAGYVWGSYGATALLVAVEIFGVLARRRRACAEAQATAPDNLSAATGGSL
jgi:heme exporter protein D